MTRDEQFVVQDVIDTTRHAGGIIQQNIEKIQLVLKGTAVLLDQLERYIHEETHPTS